MHPWSIDIQTCYLETCIITVHVRVARHEPIAMPWPIAIHVGITIHWYTTMPWCLLSPLIYKLVTKTRTGNSNLKPGIQTLILGVWIPWKSKTKNQVWNRELTLLLFAFEFPGSLNYWCSSNLNSRCLICFRLQSGCPPPWCLNSWCLNSLEFKHQEFKFPVSGLNLLVLP